MKASEWIQSVEKQVIQDKVVPNKPVKLFGSSLVSLNREYFLLLLSQNVCYLIEHKRDTFPNVIQVQWSISLSFNATAIRLHPNGRFGALIGEHGVACFSIDVSSLKWKVANRHVVIDVVEVGRSRSHNGLFDLRSDLTIVDVCWHPSSSSHLCLLTSDNTLWFWNVLNDVEEEEQRLSVKLPDSSSVTSFCFGTGPGWEFFTVYIASSKGDIYCLCPVYPFGCFISTQLFNSLRELVRARYSRSSEEAGLSRQLSFSPQEESEKVESGVSWTKDAFNSKHFSEEKMDTIDNARQQYLFLEECWMACEMNEDLKTQQGHRNSYLFLGRTISRWEPRLQGPIFIEKDMKNSFQQGQDFYLRVLDSLGPFPTLIHTSTGGYIRIYIQLGKLEPLFTTSDVWTSTDKETQLSESRAHFVLFENVELFPNGKKESYCPVVFTDFGERFWYRNKWLSNDLKENGPMLFIGTESQLFQLRIPWLHITSEELRSCVNWSLSKIELLATVPKTLEKESSPTTCFYVCGVSFFTELECLGIISNFGHNGHMIWIPLVHFPRQSRPWDRWTSMALELDAVLKQEDDETLDLQRPLEKRCKELLKVIAKPPRYADNKEMNQQSVELEAGLRFLQDAVTKYREEYISNFEKLSLILTDAMEKIPKGLEKVERRLERVQLILKESEAQLTNLENRLSLCKRISKSLLERAQTIREALMEGRGRLSKAEIAWNERLSAQWKDISSYQFRMKEVKKSVEHAFQGLVKEPSEKPSCFTREELDNIYQSLNEHTIILNKMFSLVTKLEQASAIK